RHADEGRHPRLPPLRHCKTWMPTFVGMTGPKAGASLNRFDYSSTVPKWLSMRVATGRRRATRPE
ncbi:MAG TPA: hypothetical protein VGG99_13580, partial [Acetobacteraceae bacterium]